MFFHCKRNILAVKSRCRNFIVSGNRYYEVNCLPSNIKKTIGIFLKALFAQSSCLDISITQLLIQITTSIDWNFLQNKIQFSLRKNLLNENFFSFTAQKHKIYDKISGNAAHSLFLTNPKIIHLRVSKTFVIDCQPTIFQLMTEEIQ